MKASETSIRLAPDFLDRNSGQNSMDLISSFDKKPSLKLLTKGVRGNLLW